MREFALEHVADDLHVAVAVGAEAGTGHDPVFVDDPQWPELDVLRVVIPRERKRVVGLEPAVVGIAAVGTAPGFRASDTSCGRAPYCLRMPSPSEGRRKSAPSD